MELRVYSVCRQCAAVTLAGRGCPRCDEDHDAGFEIARVGAVAAEAPERYLAMRARPVGARPVLAALSAAVLLSAALATVL